MSPEESLSILQARCGDAIERVEAGGIHPCATVRAAAWHAVALVLRDEPRLGFNWLRCITGIDHLEDGFITLVYELHAIRPAEAPVGAWRLRGELAVRVRTPRDRAHVPTVSDVWPAADWHEREAYDLLGVTFDGHPDLRRILCCDDWVGHPLRRDYEFPLEYHGIPAVTEFGQTRPQH